MEEKTQNNPDTGLTVRYRWILLACVRLFWRSPW